MDGGFVWDDRLLITSNAHNLDEWSDIVSAFTKPLGATDAAYYRPVLLSTFVIDRQIAGPTASAFHQTNLILHCVNVGLIWTLLFAFSRRRIASTVGALCFALHPLQTHAVALIAGRHDLLLVPPVVALLLVYRVWWRSGEKAGVGLYAAIVASFAWALWTKEAALMLPPILILADRLILAPPKPSLSLRVVLLLFLGATAAAYFAVRWSIFGTPIGGTQYGNPTLMERLSMVVATYGYYIQHTLVPFDLSATPYYRRLTETGSVEFLRALLLCGTCGYLWFAAIDWLPLVSFGFGFFALWLLPVAGFIPMKMYMLEPRAYPALIGVAFCVVAAVDGMADARGAADLEERPRWIRVGVAALALVAFAFADRNRIPQFRDEMSLWTSTVAAVPESSYARNSLGYALMETKRTSEALDQYQQAIGADEDDPAPRFNHAWLLERTGKRSEAIVELRELLRRSPEHLGAINSLAVFLLRSNQLEEAQQVAERGLQLSKDNPELLFNLGQILEARGRPEEALTSYQRLTQIEPERQEYWKSLGRTFRKLNRHEDAVAAYEKALSIGPDSGLLEFLLGSSYWKVGNGSQALIHAQRAQQMGYADRSLLADLSQAGFDAK
ncbi:MAG TPA: tetratricopeptide repeat protein [Candidatus Acidoferrales bacterium]|nr:tetratricopeptide repeat protein [Candidatus Acidoferrales bacterium]